MSYNLDMDTARAAAWKKKVDTELELVRECLNKVTMVTKECEVAQAKAGEDTIMNAINVAGTQLTEKWNTLNNKFQEVQDLCAEIINETVKSGERSKEMIEQYRNRNR